MPSIQSRIINYLKKSVKGNITSKFHFLTPVVADNDKAKSYIDALKAGVDNPEVQNIALCGAYGSGKSSILKAFEKKDTQYHFLNIPLTAFKNSEKAAASELFIKVIAKN